MRPPNNRTVGSLEHLPASLRRTLTRARYAPCLLLHQIIRWQQSFLTSKCEISAMEAENQPPQLRLAEASQSKGKQAPADANEHANKHSQPRDIPASKKRLRDEDHAQVAGENAQGAGKRMRRESKSRGPEPQSQVHAQSSIKSRDAPGARSRSYTPLIPKTRNKYLQLRVRQRQQRSKLHRANLKAQRDFPYTLKALQQFAAVLEDSSGSEYTPSNRTDSAPTSGLLTPEPQLEPISNEDLFGLRARPVTPAPPTPSTPSFSSPAPSCTSCSSSSSSPEAPVQFRANSYSQRCRTKPSSRPP